MGSAAKLEYPEESFPTLQPAFVVKVWGITSKYAAGNVHAGGGLFAVPFEHGVVESVGNFEPRLKMQISSGCDYFKIDGDGKYGRPQVKAVFTDDEGRSVIGMAEGVTELSDALQGVLNGTAGEGALPFKYSVEHFKMESGHEAYKALENMVFVCSNRFLVKADGSLGVELRVSRVISGTGNE
ncbi:hypothetical protein GQ53DRAFT_867104 [Thozetella sp. PMI_491]|nr:hypothetical protein GQ53DRAFT_867104 [Thozetella sp. PMI_491]